MPRCHTGGKSRNATHKASEARATTPEAGAVSLAPPPLQRRGL